MSEKIKMEGNVIIENTRLAELLEIEKNLDNYKNELIREKNEYIRKNAVGKIIFDDKNSDYYGYAETDDTISGLMNIITSLITTDNDRLDEGLNLVFDGAKMIDNAQKMICDGKTLISNGIQSLQQISLSLTKYETDKLIREHSNETKK